MSVLLLKNFTHAIKNEIEYPFDYATLKKGILKLYCALRVNTAKMICEV